MIEVWYKKKPWSVFDCAYLGQWNLVLEHGYQWTFDPFV